MRSGRILAEDSPMNLMDNYNENVRCIFIKIKNFYPFDFIIHLVCDTVVIISTTKKSLKLFEL